MERIANRNGTVITSNKGEEYYLKATPSQRKALGRIASLNPHAYRIDCVSQLGGMSIDVYDLHPLSTPDRPVLRRLSEHYITRRGRAIGDDEFDG